MRTKDALGRIATGGDPRWMARTIALAIALFASLLLAPVAVLAASPNSSPPQADGSAFSIGPAQSHWSLLSAMELSDNIPGSASLDAVQSGQYDATFRRGNGAVPNIKGSEAVWVRASLTNTGPSARDLRIALKYPQPQRIGFHVQQEDGTFASFNQGSATASENGRSGRFPNAPLYLAPGETRTVYLRIQSPGPILVPLQVFDADRFTQAMNRDFLIFGLMIGCLLAIGLHSALTFSAAREAAFGWFVLFSICGAGFILTATGIAKAFVYPGIAFNSNTVLMAVQAIGNAASAMFLASYLKTSETAPRLHKVIVGVAILCLPGAFVFAVPEKLELVLAGLGVVIGPTVLFTVNAYLAVKGRRAARGLLVGWTMLQAATVWIFLRALDLVPYTEANHYALPLAATFAALHFSWALTNRARRAEHQAQHDTLTGLPNRVGLAMHTKMGGRSLSDVAAVLVVDLDGFKAVNDTRGHAAGDHVLKVVAERFCAVVRDDGAVFRLGGDEFVVVVAKRRKPVNIISLANGLVVAAAQPIAFRDDTAHIGASVGVAVPNASDAQLADVIERGDEALYAAKREGKGRVALCNFAAQLDTSAQKTASSETLIKAA